MELNRGPDLIRERGEWRLMNWGEWCAGDTSKKLRMPSQAAFARLYQPELGDVWAEPGEVEAETTVDESQAAAVEREVLRMSHGDRYLLMLAYVFKYPVTSSRRGVPSLVRRTGMNQTAVEDALSRLTHHFGSIRV